MNQKFNGEKTLRNLERLTGSARMEETLSAIQQADEAEDYYYSLLLRYDYACYATFHDDPPKAMPVAVEFSTIFEEHPDVLGPSGIEAYLMIMQMAIDPVEALPQIPIAQWEDMMEQFLLLIKRYNLGKRVYWWQMCQFMIPIDKKKAFFYFQKFWKTGRDALSDCRACERCYAIRMHLLMGDEEGAAEHAKPIKGRHIRFCSDTPHLMHLAYIEFYMDKGDLKSAIPYARQLKRIGHRDRGDLSYVGAVLRCFAYSDLEAGVELMREGFLWIASMWNQKMVYNFYKGAWTICHQLAKRQDTISIDLPEQLSCYQKDGIYTIQELEEWIYTRAKEIAERFDTRNGTNSYSKNLALAIKEPHII